MQHQSKITYYRNTRLRPGHAAWYFDQLGDVKRVLDVGCGVGDLGRLKPSPKVGVWGVDVDEGALVQAAPHEKVAQVDFDAEPLPFKDETFDAVVARDVLEHLLHPAVLVHELRRVMRPSGVLIASMVMAKPKAVWADYTHVRGFTKTSARTLVEDGGFSIEGIWPMGGVPLSDRLGFTRLVPLLLRVPPLGMKWASSWEMRARK